MYKTIFLTIAFIFSSIACFAQDSSTILKHEKYVIDSMVRDIDSGVFKMSSVTGASRIKGSFKGIVYKNKETQQVRRLSLIIEASGEEQEFYLEGDKILKIIQESRAYYFINNIYYNDKLERIVLPVLLESFSDNEITVKNLLTLFPAIQQ